MTERAVPLVVHVIHRLVIGGMENGLVNLINGTPPDRYRHAIICLDRDSDFRERIQRSDTEILNLHKQPGKDPAVYLRLWKALRRMRPDIVHTRNLPTIDLAVPVALAGVRHRIHGEHGRDVHEMRGENRKYNMLRRLVSPLIFRHIAVSRDLAGWLVDTVGIPARKVVQIYNGVDCDRFHPPAGRRDGLPVDGFADPDSIVFGTVGRMETVKDQLTLAHAFVDLRRRLPEAADRLRLVMVGDGSLREAVAAILAEGGAADAAWLAGARNDAPDMLRGIDVFVLPSKAEGISNTILEAMASGRPVVATAVGGNPELVVDGTTGCLVPPDDPAAMAEALARYVAEPARITAEGAAGRARAESEFSLTAMVEKYLGVYDQALTGR